MCGSLRRENLSDLVGKDPVAGIKSGSWGYRGDKFSVKYEGKVVEAMFNGHARGESLKDWLAKGWKVGYLRVGAYTEGQGQKRRVYNIPKGHGIKVVAREVNGKHVFNIVTRPAVGAEKEVHHRFPVVEKLREVW